MKVVLVTESEALRQGGFALGVIYTFSPGFQASLSNLTPALLARPKGTRSLRYPNMNISLGNKSEDHLAFINWSRTSGASFDTIL